MILVNLFGAPGAGKSTGAAYIREHDRRAVKGA
jgi:adenylate kinase family enzyme